ncbi:alpha/beta hydrolase [Microbulbifer salipaludis]|uniref:Alpha/beta hydrolase n=1 Tax=Microbulbifer salipaludis TaxID=187980 RepID=A0ABS3E7N4_9GAMM|nr:alpha/beta hydrolase [Microbulbifer salipaludis]MBN8431314.1 alpha/beta hydrolase [Microbulbifer salipaludis]
MNDCIRSTLAGSGGLPVVLLPGTLCDGRMWRHQRAALGAQAPVLVGSMTGADSIQGLASGLLAALPPRFALAGFSMGGIVALEMLRQAPERIAGLALLDTNYGEDLPERAAAREGQVADALAGGLTGLVRGQLLPNYFAAANRDNPALAQEVVDMAEAVGELAFVHQARALGTRTESLGLLGEFAAPALVLCGKEDLICPVAMHEAMAAALPQAELVVVPDAGHMAPIEQPQAVSDALGRWLEHVLQKEVTP